MANTYNTGNPTGSSDVRDAYDNASNFDEFANSTSETFTSRLGVAKLTQTGVIQRYATFNLRGAWVTATAYNVNDVWSYNGAFYRVPADYTSGATAQADIDAGNAFLHQDALDRVETVDNVAALRLLTASELPDGKVIYLKGHTVQGVGGGELIVKGAQTTEVDDNGVTFVVDGKVVRRDSLVNIEPKMFGALGDGSNATAALNAAIAFSDSIYISDGDYGLTPGGLSPLTGKQLIGESKLNTRLIFTSEQLDCLTTEGDTLIENMYVDGGWDGATPSQAGDIIRAAKSTFSGEVHLKDLRLINAKQDCISFSNIGYSSIENVQSNVSGRIGLHLDGEDKGAGPETVTSVELVGKNRFSDCPNGFGIRVYDAHCCDLSNSICEFTAGIEIAGSNNRTLVFDNVYQEFGSFPDAYTFTGSGVGLTITNNFLGGKSIPNTAGFFEVTMYGNSNSTSIAPIQFNDVIVFDSGQQTTPLTTGPTSVTTGSLVLGSGLWEVSCVIQTENAGGSSLVSLASLITLSPTDSAYQTSTASIVGLSDVLSGGPSPESRMKITGLLSLSASATVYFRFGHDQLAGQIAYAWKATFKKVK